MFYQYESLAELAAHYEAKADECKVRAANYESGKIRATAKASKVNAERERIEANVYATVAMQLRGTIIAPHQRMVGKDIGLNRTVTLTLDME